VVDSQHVIAGYWASAEARRWDDFADLVAEDVVYEVPQSRERVRGRDAFVRFNVEGFPGDWHLTVERIVTEGSHAASWIEFAEEGKTQPGVCFFEIDGDGRIIKITDFWPDPYDAPAARAHLVERY
jgi:predicted ester cyclase